MFLRVAAGWVFDGTPSLGSKIKKRKMAAAEPEPSGHLSEN